MKELVKKSKDLDNKDFFYKGQGSSDTKQLIDR